MKAAALIVLAACAHEKPRPSPELRRLPLRVAQDVLAHPPSLQPRAQIFREALIADLREQGLCVDGRGDFEVVLQVDVTVARDALELHLIVDKATGVRIDDRSEQIDAPLPQSAEGAREMLRPFVLWLADSSALRPVAEDSSGCRGCCL